MSDGQGMVAECDPQEAWTALSEDTTAQLVDVRTRAEWSFVGVPDMSALGREPALIEWRMYPNMAVNDHFADNVKAALGGAFPSQIFFLCRSGARSMEAAHAVRAAAAAEGVAVRCVNVAEGFEGDLDHDRHRGGMNGWKARGLSWRQS